MLTSRNPTRRPFPYSGVARTLDLDTAERRGRVRDSLTTRGSLESLTATTPHTERGARTRSHSDILLMSAVRNTGSAFRRLTPTSDADRITELLADLRAGRREAFDQILPLVYHELRRAASHELLARPSDTLSTTALVHELYLKFARAGRADWQNRSHFLGAAAVAMRHILVDHARRRKAEKRGGPHRHVTLDEDLAAVDTKAESLLELHDALDELAKLNPRLARVVECRFFGGMSEQETAEALGIAVRTVRRDWIKARGLLYQALGEDARAFTPASPMAEHT